MNLQLNSGWEQLHLFWYNRFTFLVKEHLLFVQIHNPQMDVEKPYTCHDVNYPVLVPIRMDQLDLCDFSDFVDISPISRA